MEENESVMQEIDNVGPIQRYYYEADMARMERANKRWFYAWLITFILLIGCVAGFIWYESQFEEIVITAEQTADGQSNNYAIGGDFVGSTPEGNSQAANP